MAYTFDPEQLAKAARAAEQGEHYIVVASSADRRVGVGARCGGDGEFVFFIEVSAQLCQRGPGFDIPALKNLAVLLQSLKSMGYDMGCEMGLVTCEKALARDEVDEELATVCAMLGL